eukprot:m.13647 g.13647  ORF g.13647 m.13647 type:complete len:81 (+) comp25141_c0_seq2:43-285(+)
MVCVPCIIYGVIPFLVWIWNKFLVPVVWKFFGWEVKSLEKGSPTCPVSKVTSGSCPAAKVTNSASNGTIAEKKEDSKKEN